MPEYMVIHSPRESSSDRPDPPTRLLDLARIHGPGGARPRWLRAWSPSLHDDRIFSYWEADNAAEILETIAAFGFLDDMEATAINVREWGPTDVIEAING